MNAKNSLTIIIGSLLTIVPQLLTVVPAQYRDIASGLLAAALAAWHLYQPAPNASKTRKKLRKLRGHSFGKKAGKGFGRSSYKHVKF